MRYTVLSALAVFATLPASADASTTLSNARPHTGVAVMSMDHAAGGKVDQHRFRIAQSTGGNSSTGGGGSGGGGSGGDGGGGGGGGK